jgi:hypothetical protein
VGLLGGRGGVVYCDEPSSSLSNGCGDAELLGAIGVGDRGGNGFGEAVPISSDTHPAALKDGAAATNGVGGPTRVDSVSEASVSTDDAKPTADQLLFLKPA